MATDMLTTGRAAEILGTSRQHVVDLCDSGSLPCVRVGTHRRIPKDALDDFLGHSLTHQERKSWLLHLAVANELLVRPDPTLRRARANIVKGREVHRPGSMAAGYLARWEALLDEGIDSVIQVLVDRGQTARDLRSTSPFAGVLSERQRAKILERAAGG